MNRFTLVALLGLLAVLASAAVAWAASPGMIASSAQVPSACADAQGIFNLDPVVAPGPHCTPSEHDHQHVGPVGVDSDETYFSAMAKATGFVIPGIHSWAAWPVLTYNGVRTGIPLSSSTGAKPGSAAQAKGAAFYYRRKGIAKGKAVQPFPHGFAMVLHDGDVVNGVLVNRGTDPGAGRDEIGYKCGPGDGVVTAVPPTKCTTNILTEEFVFPNCWNGEDNIAFFDQIKAGNMSYPVNNACPAAFPINLPRLQQFRRMDVTQYQKGAATLDPAAFLLGGHSITEGGAHADYVANWDDDTQAAFLAQCLNFRNTAGTIVGRDCGTNPANIAAVT